ncbi:drug/metabolite transporter (DMT)-like permease [Inquilinus ginsengisoli]|uniref:DMT family transporter n=1 Tax=Inquilinus ginsengisoli TaxID=363840 RepID=UPI003D1EFD5A
MSPSADIAGKASGSSAPLLGLLLCSFLWATAYLLMKVLGTDFAPMPLTAIRGVLGGGLLALWLLARGQGILPRGREWRDWIVLGILQGIIPNTLTAYALADTETGLAALIAASSPLMVAVLAHWLFADQRLTGRRAGGVLAGFAGMAILIGPAAFAGSGLLGPLAMLATAASYAFGVIYVRGIPSPQPVRLALGQQVFSGLPTMIAVLAVTGPSAFAAAPAHGLELLAFGVFSTALPIALYMQILRLAGPTLGSMNAYLTPVWTVLLGVLVLHETVGPREILGGLVVLGGIAIASSANRRRAA